MKQRKARLIPIKSDLGFFLSEINNVIGALDHSGREVTKQLYYLNSLSIYNSVKPEVKSLGKYYSAQKKLVKVWEDLIQKARKLRSTFLKAKTNGLNMNEIWAAYYSILIETGLFNEMHFQLKKRNLKYSAGKLEESIYRGMRA